jgi:hypothetical protein
MIMGGAASGTGIHNEALKFSQLRPIVLRSGSCSGKDGQSWSEDGRHVGSGFVEDFAESIDWGFRRSRRIHGAETGIDDGKLNRLGR